MEPDDDVSFDDETPDNSTSEGSASLPAYRGATNDPFFGLLIAGAVSIGLMPLAESDPDLRYTLTWGLLAGFAVLSWLMGNFPRITEEQPEDLAWGIVFGLILGIPLLAFGTGLLSEISNLVFPSFGLGTALAYLVFVMPLGETLFFRGILQQLRAFWEVGLIATVWGLVLFFPLINTGPYPLIVALILAMTNILYGYVRLRNGLAAAWLCQIMVNLVVFFIPFI